MLEEEGVVVGIEGDFAEVETPTRHACGSCSAKSGCGTSLLASLFPDRKRTFLARNGAGARAGDRVIIGLRESDLQIASLLLYLLPILGLIGGALAGTWLAKTLHSGDGELLSILTGIASMAAVLAWIRRGRFAGSGEGRFQAVILRVIPAPTVGLKLQDPT